MLAGGNGGPRRFSDLLRAFAVAVFGLFTLGLLVATGLALIGTLPWLMLTPQTAAGPEASAGMWLQLGLTLMAVALAYGLSAHLRMARLETGQRSFAVAIEDVIRARRMRPDGERAALFAHAPGPDADPRGDHRIDPRTVRARVFLQRQQAAVESLAEELDQAQRTCDDLRQRLDEIEAGERDLRHRLRLLAEGRRDDGLPVGETADDGTADNVIRLADRALTARHRAPVRPERPLPRR
ncbi:hypothetical protein LHP98_01640 [Rhodobacter sp. Har01]|uniref:hypothetical protein n=1 Tax=Rhodobacter sp. Har01 TaxID=2883999 RepID=UPI001D090CE4|nr:hypothetical protein [Rhodobacter sp. Har01]MCB6176829.1 hypothetical protein [Rhodobacter sp. Har01]